MPPKEPPSPAKVATQIAISFVVLLAALWVLLSKNYDDTYVKWATGTIGVVLGYWLR